MALDFVAGMFGGAAGVIVGHPFDTVKVRLQAQDPAASVSKRYNGTIDCFRKIIKQESVLGLYKGVSSPLAGLAFINAIVFGVYGNTMKLFDNSDFTYCHVLAGACAGFAQSFVCSPMELAKLKIQLQGQGVRHYFFWNPREGIYRNPTDFVLKLHRRSGTRALFKGLSLTIVRDLTGFALYFAAYDSLARLLTKRKKEGELLNAGELLLAGGLAGMFSWLLNYPVDVVKTRYQSDVADNSHAASYKNIPDCIRQTYAQGGWRAFTQGLTPTLLRAFPTNAVTFLTVTMVYRFWNGVQKKREAQDESVDEFWNNMAVVERAQAPGTYPH